MIVPGIPRSVSLSSFDGTSLQVSFSAPDDNGGDAAMTYLIEYDTQSNFATRLSLPMTAVSGGQPFYFIIPNLVRGTPYFVRVRAVNSQGAGAPASTYPLSEYPREIPTAPTNVQVAITSGRVNDGKVTVTWDAPTCDGGDVVTQYRVKWDVVPSMNSLELAPNKGEVPVLVSASDSYTISNLTPGRTYYIMVAAENSVGRRYTAAPLSIIPAFQRPGKPSNVELAIPGVCASVGCITVDWDAPVVPAHGIFCSGLATPNLCPATMGRNQEADGGSPITHYTLEWSRDDDFCNIDGTADVPSSATGTFSYTISSLPQGLAYYVRLYAVNGYGRSDAQMGMGVIGTGGTLVITVPF